MLCITDAKFSFGSITKFSLKMQVPYPNLTSAVDSTSIYLVRV